MHMIYCWVACEFPPRINKVLSHLFVYYYFFIINLNLQSNQRYQINIMKYKLQYLTLNCSGVEV